MDNEHPDLEEVLERWEDIALDHSTWTALARILDYAADLNYDTDRLTIAELTEMTRAGVCFIMQALPDLDFKHRADAIVTAHTVASLIQLVVLAGVRYPLAEARRLAHEEAYGL